MKGDMAFLGKVTVLTFKAFYFTKFKSIEFTLLGLKEKS